MKADIVQFKPIRSLPLAPLCGIVKKIVKYYKSCIAKEIVKCDSKVVLLRTSKSKNLQDYAKMEAQKADFFNAEKEMLVKEMIEMQLKPKPYKVELFLNHRFQERDRYKK
jgi:hypothetical protein